MEIDGDALMELDDVDGDKLMELDDEDAMITGEEIDDNVEMINASESS